MERIPADGWRDHRGHVARYEWAARLVRAKETVNDVACGVGYAALLLGDVDYHGYDLPGIPDPSFGGTFHEVDLDADPVLAAADVTMCFETLEHVADPAGLAARISDSTRRMILVSVPTVPTTHVNGFHRHDFTIDDVPPLFSEWRVTDRWAQPDESCHVWRFAR